MQRCQPKLRLVRPYQILRTTQGKYVRIAHFPLVTRNSQSTNCSVRRQHPSVYIGVGTEHLSPHFIVFSASPTGRFRNLPTDQTFVVAAVRLDELITRLNADRFRYSSERPTTAKAL